MSSSSWPSEIELRIIAHRVFSSVTPPLQDGDQVTFAIQELFNKNHTSPASKAAVEAMPAMRITNEEKAASGECAICLSEYNVGEEVKEMPCKHVYHSGCIDKWLGIHGSCPLCRYELPMDKVEDDDDDSILVVSFFIRRAAGRRDSGNLGPDNSDSEDPLDRDDMEIDFNETYMEDID